MTDLEFDNRQKYAASRVNELKCKLSYEVTRELDYDDSVDGIDSDTAIKVLKIRMANLRRLLEDNGIKTRYAKP